MDTTIYFDKSLLNANGFFEVKNNTTNLGKPFELIGIDEIGLVAWGTPKGLTSSFKMKWVPDKEFWNNSFFHFSKRNYDYIEKGIYFTEFTHAFNFHTHKTDKLTFKINFEIK